MDFDSRTGLNNVTVVASGGNGYATATDNQLVITTGTVNSVSVVGYVVAEFSIENRSGLRPTTAGRTLDVASTGEAGLDFGNVTFPVGVIPISGIVDNGTGQAGATSTSFILRSAAAFATSELVGHTIYITGGTGVGQSRLITANVGATDTLTIDPAWTTTTDNTSTYIVYPTPPGSTTAPAPANVVQINSVSTSSVTTVNANIGTTQPINFTGTGASALAKSDMVDIAGAVVSTSTAQIGSNLVNIAGSAVNTSSAQLGVNVVNFGGSAGTFSGGRPEVNTTHLRGTSSVATAGYVGIDWAQIINPTTVQGLTNTTIGTISSVSSVPDSSGVTTLLSRIGSAISISAGIVAADMKKINNVTVNGTGVFGSEWGP